MENDRVSIITPLYNSELFFKATFSSVLNQSYQDWEMIVVDDFSQDRSLELAKQICEKDDRVKLIRLKENNGAAVARNTAIQAAQGRYIAFLDSDDIWYPTKLEKQIRFMRENDLPFSYTAYEKIDEANNVFGLVGVPGKLGYNDLLKTCFIGCLTAVYDTKKLGKVYMPVDTRREDFATWLSIIKKVEHVYGINEVLAQYRVYETQGSANKLNMAKENWHLYRNIENLSFIRSSYYFSHYAIRGVLRTRFPQLAKMLRVLS